MDDLIELEHAGWASLCNGTGGKFYGELMTDDALMVLANGAVMTRDDVVDALEKSPPWSAYEIDDVQIVPVGDDATALVYVGTGHRDEANPPFVGAMTSVYVRRDGDWKLALYQQTPKQS